MKAPTRLLLIAGICLSTAIGQGVGSPSDVAIRAIEETREAGEFSFEVSVPAPVMSGGPEAAELKLEGYWAPELRPGAPDLPSRTILVAIPPGVTPRLEITPQTEELLGVVPRAVAREVAERVVEGPGPMRARELGQIQNQVVAREDRSPDPALYRGNGTYPGAIAVLGEVGILREQRYVEVRLTPARFDPAAGGVRIARSFRISVKFEGDSGERTEPSPDRLLESVYRSAFVNYAQGTTFRVRAEAPQSFAPTPDETLVGGPRYKIKVRQNGVVRLDFAKISPTPFISQNLATWKLTSRGVEVPLEINDDGDGILESGEWVQFYGQALDDEPKAILNSDIPNTDQDLYEARDFSDENIYFLTVEAGARSRMPLVPSAPTMSRVPPLDWEAISHVETDSEYHPLSDADPWYWGPTLCFSGCQGVPSSRTDSVPLPNLRLGTLPVRVTVKVRGSSEDMFVFPDHHTKVTLLNASNQTVGTANNDDGTFDGRTLYTHDFSLTPAGNLATNPVKVKFELLSSGTTNQAILDWIEVHYQRTFDAIGDGLTFDWPDGDAEFVVSGLTTATPSIYEITGRVGGTGIVASTELTGATPSGAGPFSVRFRVDNDPSLPDLTLRRFVVAGNGAAAIPAPLDFAADAVSDLRSTSNQADLIVIAYPSFVDLSPTSALSKLLNRRAAEGISSKIALIEDVQDEFNEGLAGPQAIKKFLSWVMSTNLGEGWGSPKPAYVLLLGDGTFDYKGGPAQGNFVPTQIVFKNVSQLGYYASDNLLANVVGPDQLADLVVGRLSARNSFEAGVMLQKVFDYDDIPPTGSWRQKALFISDRGKTLDSHNEAKEFEATNNAAESYMRIPPFVSQQLRYWTDYCDSGQVSCDIEGMRADIKSTVTAGAALLQYTGHGNFTWWSNDAFFDNEVDPPDTDSLMNGGKLPLVVIHNCLSNAFHVSTLNSTDSMGEAWMKRQGGGAIATWAPSSLSFNYIGRQVTEVLWNAMFGPRKERSLAEPLMDALTAICPNSIEPCQSYVLLGDPSMNLILPSVAPASELGATPGNKLVNLAWTASATPGVVYDVYRTTGLPPPPGLLPVGTVPGTVFSDTGLTNLATYYYWVVARDAQGFESRWSNFNSDCAINGPDCVKATPVNPNPPASPTGVIVSDPETNGRLFVTWTPPPDDDLLTYTIGWGPESGSQSGTYANTMVVTKNITAYGLSGLENGTRYYIAVKATNTSGHTSGYSLEASGIPTDVEGIRSPGFIRTLKVARSGNNTVLTWDAVTTDIYGKPETVANYEVYRGTTPVFMPTPGNRIGAPVAPTWTDTNAILAPGQYYYLVRAVDTNGNLGGLGAQLPDGIRSLHVTQSPTDSSLIDLSWTAVTKDFDGNTITIDHYNVYTAAAAFPRDAITSGAVQVLTTTTSVSVSIAKAPTNQWISVLAVDARGNLSPF